MSDALIKLTDEESQIFSCLNLDLPKSFFLFAGAGSGKTHSLVQVLKKFKLEHSRRLKLNGQKIAIITYTNAASDEIKQRLEFDSTFTVSTIHSFSWELIKHYQTDLREWIERNLNNEIYELEDKLAKGRAGTKISIDRARKITSKKNRLDSLKSIKKFSYNPNGTNSSRDSLNHAEVIKITSEFLLTKPLMQQILVKKYPILLIDESQDTKKELIEAFFKVESNHRGYFTLGLFGDTMQRIYTDGKIDLGKNIPEDWEKPSKRINYRCPTRVIELINKIRSEVDNQSQEPDKKEDGYARLFIINSDVAIDKSNIEKVVSEKMGEITSDKHWFELRKEVKCLTLEHHMAANRGGFFDFFEPLYKSSNDSTGLLDGSMKGVAFLRSRILPLIEAKKQNDEFAATDIVKKYSPLIDKKALRSCKNQLVQIRKVNFAVNDLLLLFGNDYDKDPTLFEILKNISKNNIFKIPEVLSIIINREETEFIEDEEEKSKSELLIEAWEKSLKVPYSQLKLYDDYISDNSSFGTHQGIKGLEFPRVMVILDDEEARGFLFSYEKLLGAKELSDTDKKNISEGKDTSIDRTRRLFYVACSRAEESLAIIAYTKQPESVKNFAISQKWFAENEIMLFDGNGFQ